MPVTEVALLRLKSQEPSARTKTGLRQANETQSKYSNFLVTFLRQVEDSSYFYLIGGWESIAVHYNDWIPSDTNQATLQIIKDEVYVEWLIHLDKDPSAFRIPLDASVVEVSRFFVELGRKEEFDAAYSGLAVDPTISFPYTGGWRIEKHGEDEEFVLFVGAKLDDDMHGHLTGDKVYRMFNGVCKSAEIKCGRLERWSKE